MAIIKERPRAASQADIVSITRGLIKGFNDS